MLPRGGSSSAVPSGWWHLSWQQLVVEPLVSENSNHRGHQEFLRTHHAEIQSEVCSKQNPQQTEAQQSSIVIEFSDTTRLGELRR